MSFYFFSLEVWATFRHQSKHIYIAPYRESETHNGRDPSIHLYLSNNKQFKVEMKIGPTVGQDSETKSTEHCPKYKQSTV